MSRNSSSSAPVVASVTTAGNVTGGVSDVGRGVSAPLRIGASPGGIINSTIEAAGRAAAVADGVIRSGERRERVVCFRCDDPEEVGWARPVGLRSLRDGLAPVLSFMSWSL